MRPVKAHLHILDLKALDVQVIQPEQRNRICNLKACMPKVISIWAIPQVLPIKLQLCILRMNVYRRKRLLMQAESY